MTSTDAETEPTAKTTYHLDRASSRTPEEREQHYQAWLAKHGEPYAAAVIAAGDTPWWSSEDERRERFMRRYR
jgi:hypothetical protein